MSENEYDTGQPGPERKMTGLFSQLDEAQKEAVLAHREPEAIRYLPSRIHEEDEPGVIVDDGAGAYLPLVLSHEEVLAAQRLATNASTTEVAILTPDGTLRAVWKRSNDHLLELEFLPDDRLRYVFFGPSNPRRHT